MSFRRLAALAIFGLVAASPAWAGNPTVSIFATPVPAQFSSTGVNHPVTQTVTVTFGSSGVQGFAALLGAFSFQGTNPADFAVVGGTCQPGTTQLDNSTTSCTVIVQYTPSSGAAENAQLFASCTTVGIVGGIIVNCNGTSQELDPVTGSVVAAVLSQLPTLDPRLLTLLATLVVGIGAYFATRKTV